MGHLATTTRRVDVRPWPGDTSIAHLILLDVAVVPSPAEVGEWTADVFDGVDPDGAAVSKIRTGALFPAAAASFAANGFEPVDRLALLERPLPPDERLDRPRRPHRDISMSRLRARDLGLAAVIDASAFPLGWRNDDRSLDDIRKATPSARSRLIRRSRQPVGMAITGKAGSTGYLQRIAVRPEARRAGVGRLLVDDALRWLVRRGATNALVNTGVDNLAALALYESRGFRRRDDDLVVMELHQ